MKLLLYLLPTFVAGILLAIAGFILLASIRRSERREAARRNSPQTPS